MNPLRKSANGTRKGRFPAPFRHVARCPLAAVVAGIVASAAAPALADDTSAYVASDGLMVYYAVLPAEMMPQFPKSSPERAMHGGLPHNDHVHHVMIALFERASSQRVTDANVTATVNEVGLGPVAKALEPFAVGDAVTYGNYFAMPGKALYQVAVTIRRPGDVEPVTLRFEYRHH